MFCKVLKRILILGKEQKLYWDRIKQMQGFEVSEEQPGQKHVIFVEESDFDKNIGNDGSDKQTLHSGLEMNLGNFGRKSENENGIEGKVEKSKRKIDANEIEQRRKKRRHRKEKLVI